LDLLLCHQNVVRFFFFSFLLWFGLSSQHYGTNIQLDSKLFFLILWRNLILPWSLIFLLSLHIRCRYKESDKKKTNKSFLFSLRTRIVGNQNLNWVQKLLFCTVYAQNKQLYFQYSCPFSCLVSSYSFYHDEKSLLIILTLHNYLHIIICKLVFWDINWHDHGIQSSLTYKLLTNVFILFSKMVFEYLGI
jgi:hypothetical protein